MAENPLRKRMEKYPGIDTGLVWPPNSVEQLALDLWAQVDALTTELSEARKLTLFQQHLADESNAAHVALDRAGITKTKAVPSRRIGGEPQDITIGLGERISALTTERDEARKENITLHLALGHESPAISVEITRRREAFRSVLARAEAAEQQQQQADAREELKAARSDNALKIACAELAGYHDGLNGMPLNPAYSTGDENLAYQLWFGKARTVRCELIDQIDTLAGLLKQATARAEAAEQQHHDAKVYADRCDKVINESVRMETFNHVQAELQQSHGAAAILRDGLERALVVLAALVEKWARKSDICLETDEWARYGSALKACADELAACLAVLEARPDQPTPPVPTEGTT